MRNFGLPEVSVIGVFTLIILMSIPIMGCLSEPDEVVVLCAAGVREPVDSLLDGVDGVVCTYGGTGALFSRIALTGGGDVLITGSEWDMQIALERGWVKDYQKLAPHVPVLMVRDGVGSSINGLNAPNTTLNTPAELSDELRLSLGKPGSCALTNIQAQFFGEEYEQRIAGAAVLRTTVNEMCEDVASGVADASIVWKASAHPYVERGEATIIEMEHPPEEWVCGAVLVNSSNHEAAQKVLDALRNDRVWESYGFTPIS
ncbi:MAG: substrate-binding domain-containing protein [Methermicoccaceae archaeon]